jgi:uncharacterized DUF497 family protein
MNYEWDKTKRQFNLDKHGLDFVDIVDFDWENALVVEDDRYDCPEIRYIAYGFLRERLTVLVFILRNESIRLISWRKANRREEKNYESQIKN